MTEDEDGKLHWCSGNCREETPHKAIKVDDKTVYECEICNFVETAKFSRQFDLPVFDKKN